MWRAMEKSLIDRIQPAFQLGYRSDSGPPRGYLIFTWANGITMLRFLGIIPYVLLIKHHLLTIAFWELWAMAILDIADGYLARRLNQMSKLGAIFDPAVDKAIMITVIATLLGAGRLPVWIAIIVGLRVVLVICISAIFRFHRQSVEITRSAKAGTLALFVGLPVFLLNPTDPLQLRALPLAALAVGLTLSLTSLCQYARQLTLHLRVN